MANIYIKNCDSVSRKLALTFDRKSATDYNVFAVARQYGAALRQLDIKSRRAAAVLLLEFMTIANICSNERLEGAIAIVLDAYFETVSA